MKLNWCDFLCCFWIEIRKRRVWFQVGHNQIFGGVERDLLEERVTVTLTENAESFIDLKK